MVELNAVGHDWWAEMWWNMISKTRCGGGNGVSLCDGKRQQNGDKIDVLTSDTTPWSALISTRAAEDKSCSFIVSVWGESRYGIELRSKWFRIL